MALLKSALLTQASGSVGGVTFSRAKGGMYIRARSMPINPDTVYQQAVRQAQGTLSARWQTTLTPTQRSGWEIYAANVPRRNRLGDTINLSGIAMYTRCNVPRLQAGLAIVDDGPGEYTTGDPLVITGLTWNGIGAHSVKVDYDAPGTNTDNVLIYVSRPISPTVNFFRGPFRYNGTADGATTTYTVQEATLLMPLTAGNDVIIRARVSYADGRLSDVTQWRGPITIPIPGTT